MHFRMRPVEPLDMMTRYDTSRLRQRVALKMDSASYAVASMGTVLGLVEYRDSETYVYHGVVIVNAVSSNGRYVYAQRLAVLMDGTPYVDTHMYAPHWQNASMFYRLADNLHEYGYIRKIQALESKVRQAVSNARSEARKDLIKLSQNTVTRALVHASDHGYCQETSIALISAGHKLPDITLSLEVTLNVTVTLEGSHNYYALRALFGATRGNVQDASDLDVQSFGSVSEMVRETVESGAFETTGIQHMDTDVMWFEPTIRMMDTDDARVLVGEQDDDF